MRVSDNDLIGLLKAAESATPGPWDFHGLSMSYHIARVEGSYHHSPRVVHATLGKSVFDRDDLEQGAGGVREMQDARFIALANPMTIKSLVEEVISRRMAASGKRDGDQ
jgi:hypothetical protein